MSDEHTGSSTPHAPPDAVLLDRVRAGDREAYAVLYERYAPNARRFARSLLPNSTDVDDVVSEMFASVLSALERGKGPVESFLPYLLSSVRNESARIARRGQRECPDGFEAVDALIDRRSEHHDPFAAIDEEAVIRTAFVSLPINFREVLWRTEVEDASPAEIAAQRGGTPQGVSVTAFRARRALGVAWLHQHLPAEQLDGNGNATCRTARPQITRLMRGTIGLRDRRQLEKHLRTCAPCVEARDSLNRLNQHLRHVGVVPTGIAAIGLNAQDVASVSASAAPSATSGMVPAAVLSPSSSPGTRA